MAIRIGVGLLGWGASAPRLEMLYAPPGLFWERLTVGIGVGLLEWGASATECISVYSQKSLFLFYRAHGFGGRRITDLRVRGLHLYVVGACVALHVLLKSVHK